MNPASQGPGRPKGLADKVSRGGQKLNPEQVRDIRRIYAAQSVKSLTDIRTHYPQVSKQNIEQIVKRKIWKNVI